MRCPQTPRQRAFTLIDLVVVMGLLAMLLGILLPTLSNLCEASQRTQEVNNLKQLGTATHNFAGTYATKMPINGYFGVRYSSVFGHLLAYVEQDNVYKLVTTNAGRNINGNVTNGTNASDSCGIANYYAAVIPAYQCPSDPTAAGLTGVAADGSRTGTASFASNGLLFNGRPGTAIAPLNFSKDGAFALAPPRLPATFASAGTSNVVMFATRYATCNGSDNYWSSPQRSYFNNAFPQTQPNLEKGSGNGAVACQPLSVQGFGASGPLVCMGDASVRSVFPNVSATAWRIALNPSSVEPLPLDWDE